MKQILIVIIIVSYSLSSVAQNNEGTKTWYQKIIDEYEQSQQNDDNITPEEADRYIDRPYYSLRDMKSCNITALNILDEYTVVKCQIQSSQTRKISFNSGAYIYDRENGDRYDFIKSEVIPIYPDMETIIKGKKYEFTLYFQPIPKYITCVDIIENPTSHNAFNFYKVDVTGNKHQQPEVKVVVKKEIVKIKEKSNLPVESKSTVKEEPIKEPKVIENTQNKSHPQEINEEKKRVII